MFGIQIMEQGDMAHDDMALSDLHLENVEGVPTMESTSLLDLDPLPLPETVLAGSTTDRTSVDEVMNDLKFSSMEHDAADDVCDIGAMAVEHFVPVSIRKRRNSAICRIEPFACCENIPSITELHMQDDSPLIISKL
jgi:hypothetical protein